MAFGSRGTSGVSEVKPVSSLSALLRRRMASTPLAIPAFRRMWVALGLSSLGDWMGLLALAALAQNRFGDSVTSQGLAVSGIFLLRLVPTLVLAPFAGVVADKLDRRLTIVVTNWLRALILLSIVAFEARWWVFAATFLLEAASMFFQPAKDAAMPTLVPREKLEQANGINLLTTYGTAPIAALIYAGLALVTGMIDNVLGQRLGSPPMVALLFDAAMFTVAGLLIWPVRELSGTGGAKSRAAAGAATVSVWSGIVQGWQFVWRTPVVRALTVGLLGAVGAGGVVIPLSALYVPQLGGGDPAFGLLFGIVFVGLAAGMGMGPRLFGSLTRRRLFGLAITASGVTLMLVALIPNMALVVLLTLLLGFWAGVAWVVGYTLLGLEVADQMRGRTFAFIQSLVRVVLALVVALAPLVATALGTFQVSLGRATLRYSGVALTLLLAGVLAAVLGVLCYLRMDDRRGLPWHAGLLEGSALGDFAAHPPGNGFFLALEGGEGAGKSLQVRRLAQVLRERGYEVVTTREPGGTDLGGQVRALVLDPQRRPMTARAEALLFAADRAENVATVIRPALEREAIVIADRYVDSSLAYQGAGRGLSQAQLLRLSRWASEGLTAHLTVVVNIAPQEGLARKGMDTDRMQQQSLQFHEQVAQAFVDLAKAAPSRYLVVDGCLSVEQVTEAIVEKLEQRLPPTDAQREQEAQQAREQEEQLQQEQQRQREQRRQQRLAKQERKQAQRQQRREKAAQRSRAQADEQTQQWLQQRQRERAQAGSGQWPDAGSVADGELPPPVERTQQLQAVSVQEAEPPAAPPRVDLHNLYRDAPAEGLSKPSQQDASEPDTAAPGTDEKLPFWPQPPGGRQ